MRTSAPVLLLALGGDKEDPRPESLAITTAVSGWSGSAGSFLDMPAPQAGQPVARVPRGRGIDILPHAGSAPLDHKPGSCMSQRIRVLVIPTLFAAACGRSTSPHDADSGGVETSWGIPWHEPDGADTEDPNTAPPDSADALALPTARDLSGEHVATSGVCAECHSNHADADAMRDASGAPVAPYDLWQGTMMANATRDPLWRAVVSAEVAAAPAMRDVIEAKCLTCHAPLATVEAGLEGEDPPQIAEIYAGSDRGMLALDGVSCTLCHQIQPDGLGTEETFSGHYAVEPGSQIYGPHADPFAAPMSGRTGFEPVYGAHIRDSGLCATCHTLTTTALTADGTALSDRSMLEQAPFLEWQASSWSRGEGARSCQGCHLPETDAAGDPLSTRIARAPGGWDMGPLDERSPYGQHTLVGGNTTMLGILRENRELLGLRASEQALAVTIALTRAQLADRTARLAVVEADASRGSLDLTVEVENLAGHKLPTGHPSRRAWLSLAVTDATGALVFTSGAANTAGELVGPDGSALASERIGGPILPHVDLVEGAEAVPVYQPIMLDAEGNPTFRLLAGVGYAKDNRLLPAGWDLAVAAANGVEPVGLGGDTDFGSGGDQVRYRLSDLEGEPPYTVEVSLLYQAVSPRYVAELAAWDTPEVNAFLTLWARADRSPEVLASARAVVP
jgi:hypothetical protein